MRVIPVMLRAQPAYGSPQTVYERLPDPCTLLGVEIDVSRDTFVVARIYFCQPPPDGHCIEIVTRFPYDASKLLVVNLRKPPDAWLAIEYRLAHAFSAMPIFNATAWVETP